MKKMIFIVLAVLLLVGIWFGVKIFFFPSAEFNNSWKAVTGCPSNVFDKSAVVFDAYTICGTKWVPQAKLKHAANVAAVWLDNNRDGKADEPRLIETLKQNKPVVMMSDKGMGAWAMSKIMTASKWMTMQDLTAQETNNPKRRDASQEEIHHLIMNAGWIKLFPKIFSDQKSENSKLYTVWKKANDNKYYSYNDPTCNDACKVTEFVYLATASYLGSKADLASDEMRLKTKAEMQEKIPEIIKIIESKDYVYPKLEWPNGEYKFSENIKYYNAKK